MFWNPCIAIVYNNEIIKLVSKPQKNSFLMDSPLREDMGLYTKEIYFWNVKKKKKIAILSLTAQRG